ncbi:MAG TPA: hypothetical protein VJH55_01265 [Candidatus Paceibacterota bacterium]
MKNLQKGFIVPALIIIALLVIGGGVYFYSQKLNSPSSQNIPTDTVNTVTSNNLSQQTQTVPQSEVTPSNKPNTPTPQKVSPPVVQTAQPPKIIISSAISKQSSMNQFRAMYSGTESASEGTQSQSISFWSQEDKQDSRLRYSLYKGVVYSKDAVTKGYIGSIAETMYHFLNRDISVSCVNTDQFCQSVGNSFAEYFARATASRGMELQSISKLFGLQVYGEPSLMNITNGVSKSITLDTYVSGKATVQSSICDYLNIVFAPTEVKKLASPSGELSYQTIDASQSKFHVNLCVDRTTGLIDEYNTDLTIVSTDGQRQHSTSNGKLLGYSTEVVFNNEFPFSSKVEQYNK